MKKRILLLLGIVLTLLFLVTSCQTKKEEPKKEEKPQEPVVEETAQEVTLLLKDDEFDRFLSKDVIKAFEEEYPEIKIKKSKTKDIVKYYEELEETEPEALADIVVNEAGTISQNQDKWADLAALDSEFVGQIPEALEYADEEAVYGIPLKMETDYVFYWKDLFAEQELAVPETWSEFVETALALTEKVGSEDPEFISLGCGFKDIWPCYPYMEILPVAETSDIYTAYEKVYQLLGSEAVSGDLLSLGRSEVTSLFASRKVGMMTLSGSEYQKIKEGLSEEELENLGCFYLPVRDTKEEPFRVVTYGKTFLSIGEASENKEAALTFIKWIYAESGYQEFLAEEQEFLQQASQQMPEVEVLTYHSESQVLPMESCELGVRMLTEEFDFEQEMKDVYEKSMK